MNLIAFKRNQIITKIKVDTCLLNSSQIEKELL